MPGPFFGLPWPSLAPPGPLALGSPLALPGLSLVLFVPPHWFLGSRAPTGIGPFSPLGSPWALSGPILGISGPSLFPPWPSRAFVPGPRGCKNQHSSSGPLWALLVPPMGSLGPGSPGIFLGFSPCKGPPGPSLGKYNHTPFANASPSQQIPAFSLQTQVLWALCCCFPIAPRHNNSTVQMLVQFLKIACSLADRGATN